MVSFLYFNLFSKNSIESYKTLNNYFKKKIYNYNLQDNLSNSLWIHNICDLETFFLNKNNYKFYHKFFKLSQKCVSHISIKQLSFKVIIYYPY